MKSGIDSNIDHSTDQIIKDYLATNDDDYARSLLTILHMRGSRKEFNAAISLCKSNDPDKREFGADILGQLGGPKHPFGEDSIDILIDLLKDKEDNVVVAAVYSLGHLGNSRAVPYLISLTDSPLKEIRSGLAFSLGLVTEDDDNAINSLIKLSEDQDCEVRNWATFSLGTQIKTNSPELCKALWHRINNENDWDTYWEAVIGLALRDDERILDLIWNEFINDGTPDLFDKIAGYEAYELIPLLEELCVRAKKHREDGCGINRKWLNDLMNTIYSLENLNKARENT